MPERAAWPEHFQRIGKAALLAVAGLVVGLLLIFGGLAVYWPLYVLVRLLGAKLGLWEFDLGLH
jgi:hypothetical protein